MCCDEITLAARAKSPYFGALLGVGPEAVGRLLGRCDELPVEPAAIQRLVPLVGHQELHVGVVRLEQQPVRAVFDDLFAFYGLSSLERRLGSWFVGRYALNGRVRHEVVPSSPDSHTPVPPVLLRSQFSNR